MSLIDLVKTKSFKEIALLDFNLPRIQIPRARSENTRRLDHKHLGKAIDFFVRAQLTKTTDESNVKSRTQIYESAIDAVNPRDPMVRENMVAANGRVFDAKHHFMYEEYDADETVRGFLDMAYMDSIARSYPNIDGVYALQNLVGESAETPETREELKHFIVGDLSYLPIVKRDLRIGPVFGEVGKMIGGADADLIADGTLYDVKFTMAPTTTDMRRNLLQVLGYAYLNQIEGGMNGSIHSVGFILPRQRMTIAYKLKDLSRSSNALSRYRDVERLAQFFHDGELESSFLPDSGHSLNKQISFEGF